IVVGSDTGSSAGAGPSGHSISPVSPLHATRPSDSTAARAGRTACPGFDLAITGAAPPCSDQEPSPHPCPRRGHSRLTKRILGPEPSSAYGARLRLVSTEARGRAVGLHRRAATCRVDSAGYHGRVDLVSCSCRPG